ncbi:hypothetical protein SLEP1_g3092 [Rubroshorea leprosula]|uniref:Uncharacterized protein n=1 Tax=Rubroshorea leprosula TaxID=152421 RepID=A0AAV5HJP5_9ROSI|nr:hypothetical protein SLEP1_g3092 [Rubroshorea leprosula]
MNINIQVLLILILSLRRRCRSVQLSRRRRRSQLSFFGGRPALPGGDRFGSSLPSAFLCMIPTLSCT